MPHKGPMPIHRKWMLIFAAILACTAAAAADQSASGAPKHGWTEAELKAAADGCTEGILQPTIRDYKAAAVADGNNSPKPFPEKEFRDSVWPMCSCIVNRAAEIMTVAEFAKGVNESVGSFVAEAMQGGRCKPEGMLGKILEGARDKKAGG